VIKLNEIGKIGEFLGAEPLKPVENPEDISLGEQFQLFIPDILTEKDKQLLTEFFIYKYKVYKYGRKELREEDEKRLNDLVTADAVMGGELLPFLVSKLRQISKYKKRSGRSLTSEQFRRVIRNIVFDYRVRLDAVDLKILNTINKSTYVSISRIAEQTNISRTTVHYHKQKLEKKCRLKMFLRPNYSKIGLAHLLVMVEGEAHVESPYLLSRHELWGRWLYTLFSLAVPSAAINRLEKIFERHFPRVWMWRVKRFENYFSFSGYDVDTGDWNIDWDSWALYLSEVLSEGWDQVLPEDARRDVYESPRGVVAYKELRFIAKLLENPDISSRDLGRELGYSAVHASRIRKSLIRRGILQPVLNIDHIGLTENILFIVESEPSTLNAFSQAVKELPKTWVLWMESPDLRSFLACWLELPPGSLIPFERVVRETLRPLAKYEILFRSEHEGSQFPLLELLRTKTKTVKWNPKLLKIK